MDSYYINIYFMLQVQHLVCYVYALGKIVFSLLSCSASFV